MSCFGQRRAWRRISVILLLVVFEVMGLAGCRRQSHVTPEQQYKEAIAEFDRGELPSALEAAVKGKEFYRTAQPEWAWRFRVLQAQVLVWQGRSQDSLSVLDETVPQSLTGSEVAILKQTIRGIAATYLQRFDDAQVYLAEARRLTGSTHRELLGEIARAEGTLAERQNDHASAEVYYREALALARAQNLQFLESRTLGELGVLAMLRQHYGEAIEAFSASLTISQRIGNRTVSSKTLGNLGWCYFKLGDYENAVDLSTQAEQLATRLGLEKDRLIWQTNIGSVHYESREFAEAERYYQDALEIARKLGNKSAMATCLNNLAAAGLESGQLDIAEKYNHEALEIKRSIGDASSELYSALNDARISAGRKNYPAAVGTLRRVIRESGGDVSLRWEAEADLGGVYALQGEPAHADQQFRKAIATVDTARASLAKEEHRLSFLTSATRFYNDYIDFLISKGRTDDALAVAEHSRGRALAEGLGIAVAGLSSVSFQNGLGPQQIARRKHATILAYWLKPQHSYLWAVTPSKIALFSLPSDAEIGSALEAYRKTMLAPRDVSATATAEGEKLYEMLVAPAQRLIVPGSRVIIIADGALHNLNFETLLIPHPQAHYWIEDAVISNASSLSLLAAAQNRIWRRGKELLLIGNPKSAGTEYPELSHAASEIRSIQEHFADNRRLVLAGENATPEGYRDSNPGRFSYIHFVAHGSASRVSPLDSAVVLSPGKDSYKLYAREIVKVRLRANLVTVSTCFGAGTRNYSGEGLVGLSWAFLRAGAHNVVAALWEANDASTPQLMDKFYTGITHGDDPAVALRSAKLAMLHSDTIYRKPLYWAPFQLYTGW